MKRKLFTANGLADELAIDRRFVPSRLGAVRAPGKIGKP